MKYTKQQFEQKLSLVTKDPFTITEYSGTSKPGKFVCGFCKKEYSLNRMGELLKREKHLCSHCFASQYAEQTLNLFKEITHLSFVRFDYNSNLHKPTVVYLCLNCGESTEKPLVEFLKHPHCIHCGVNAKKRTTKTAETLLPSGFEFIGKYKSQYEKTLVRHSCGFVFSIRPKDLITGHSYCPKCSKKASKGERKIMEFLGLSQIQYIKEKTFDWSDNKRYDFYLPNYNLIIEYHGQQHYHEIPNFFLPLAEQQRIDCWKESTAKERGFDYLVISYLDFDNIETILAQRLKEST